MRKAFFLFLQKFSDISCILYKKGYSTGLKNEKRTADAFHFDFTEILKDAY
jgi:hypothetical protein